MRNMMLPVKNSKSLLSLLFKRSGLLSLSVSGLLSLSASGLLSLSLIAGGLTGCKDKNEPYAPRQVDDPQWEVTVENDPNLSMVAVISVTGIESTAPGTLAAFMGDDGCGIATCINGLYRLYISPATGDGSDVQLRFYSPELKLIFEAVETFPYHNDANLGTTAEPYTPSWH